MQFSQNYCSGAPEHQKQYALAPIKEYPLTVIKQWPPLACIPQPSPSTNSLTQKLIKGARAVRQASFAARAAIVCLGSAVIVYEVYNAEDAPEDVKQFCYDQAGRSNFKVKMTNGTDRAEFYITLNTLYVPTDPRNRGLQDALKKQRELETEQQEYPKDDYQSSALRYEIEKNKKDLDLFKGILDHEITHLNNYDRYRKPLLLSASFIIMETLWRTIRSKLEESFSQGATQPHNTLKGATLLGGRWLARLIIPTALYTAAFFATRQIIKKTIEAQADAGVRDDIGVLTQMEQLFQDRAYWHKHDSYIEQLVTDFFNSHPSDQSRADYFAQRIKKLETIKGKNLSEN